MKEKIPKKEGEGNNAGFTNNGSEGTKGDAAALPGIPQFQQRSLGSGCVEGDCSSKLTLLKILTHSLQ